MPRQLIDNGIRGVDQGGIPVGRNEPPPTPPQQRKHFKPGFQQGLRCLSGRHRRVIRHCGKAVHGVKSVVYVDVLIFGLIGVRLDCANRS